MKIYHYPLLPENLKRKKQFQGHQATKLTDKTVVSNMEKTQTQIYFTGIVWKEEIHLFSQVVEMGNALNDNINLLQYGNGLNEVIFVPILVHPENKIHDNRFLHNKRKKRVEINKKLDYAKAKLYNLPEFNEVIAQLFLTSIEELKTKNIKDFDTAAFKRDAERVLIEQGWLKSKEVIEVC